MNLNQFQRILIQVLLLPVLAMAILAGALSLLLENDSRTVQQIQGSERSRGQLAQVGRLIVDEETGLRGFQVTGDRRFLQPYNEAQLRLDGLFDRLQDGTEVNPSLAAEIGKLREEHASWRGGFAQGVINAAASGREFRDPERNLQGKMEMDKVRAHLAEITRESGAQRAERIAAWQRQVRLTFWALFGLALTAGLSIGLFVRSRMHMVSTAFRGSVEEAERRADESFHAEQELRTTLRSIGDGVIRCDRLGRVQMMNPAAEQLTGWSLTEAMGTRIAEVFPVVNLRTRQPMETPIDEVLRLREPVKLANDAALARRDGTELDIADSGAPIREKDGSVCGAVMVFRDVTIERRAQEAMIAQEKLAVSGRVAATIAHEIHNPLDAVQNLLYLIRTETSTEERQQYLEMAESELARVTEISRAMLGMHRESTAMVRLDLRSNLHDVLLLMRRRFEDLGVAVDADLPRQIFACGYPGELKQVFSNLIGNAAEAAGRGGEICVQLRRGVLQDDDGLGSTMGEGAIITVHDNGPGIDAAVADQLFQPFFTTKGEQGTGLGLWLSRGIVAKHGGSLSLANTRIPGKHGSVATLFLPLALESSAGADPETPPQPSRSAPSDGSLAVLPAH